MGSNNQSVTYLRDKSYFPPTDYVRYKDLYKLLDFLENLPGSGGTGNTTILRGSGVPGSGLGDDGDYYLDSSDSEVPVYFKAGGAWSAIGKWNATLPVVPAIVEVQNYFWMYDHNSQQNTYGTNPGLTGLVEGQLYRIKEYESSIAISAVNAPGNTITVPGDFTAEFLPGSWCRIKGSSLNDGFYTVNTVTLNAGNTDVVVNETIPDTTVDGNLLSICLPDPLTGFTSFAIRNVNAESYAGIPVILNTNGWGTAKWSSSPSKNLQIGYDLDTNQVLELYYPDKNSRIHGGSGNSIRVFDANWIQKDCIIEDCTINNPGSAHTFTRLTIKTGSIIDFANHTSIVLTDALLNGSVSFSTDSITAERIKLQLGEYTIHDSVSDIDSYGDGTQQIEIDSYNNGAYYRYKDRSTFKIVLDVSDGAIFSAGSLELTMPTRTSHIGIVKLINLTPVSASQIGFVLNPPPYHSFEITADESEISNSFLEIATQFLGLDPQAIVVGEVIGRSIAPTISRDNFVILKQSLRAGYEALLTRAGDIYI